MDRNGKMRKGNDNQFNNVNIGNLDYNQDEPSSPPSSSLLNPIVVIKEEQAEEHQQQQREQIKTEIDDEANFMNILKYESNINVNSQYFIDQDPFGRTDDEFNSPLLHEQEQTERETVEMKFEVDEENWLDETETVEQEEQQEQEFHQCNNCFKTFHLDKNLEAHLKICHFKGKVKKLPPNPVITKPESSNSIEDVDSQIDNVNNSDSILSTNSQGTDGKGNKKDIKKKTKQKITKNQDAVSSSLTPWDKCPHIKWDCHLCKKKFTLSSKLLDHFRLHRSFKPLRCNVCDRNIARNHVKRHLLCHAEKEVSENKIKLMTISCSLCKKDYPIRSPGFANHCRLDLHKEWELPYRCAVCHHQGKTRMFATRKEIDNHFLTHKTRPYFCTESSCPCSTEKGKTFYKCSRCPQIFKKKNSWYKHRQCVHTFFKCAQCGRQFEGRRRRAVHNRYSCEETKFQPPVEMSGGGGGGDENSSGETQTQDPQTPVSISIKQETTTVDQDSNSNSNSNTKSNVQIKIEKDSETRTSSSRASNNIPTVSEFLPYKCALCPLAYSTKPLYHAHIRTHF